MSSGLSVIALIRGKGERRSELLALLRKVETLTQRERGCLSYDLYSDTVNPDNFYFLGIWEDQSRLDAHNQTAHVSELREASSILAYSIEVTRLSAVPQLEDAKILE